MEENKLTEKQKRFIDYYVETGNASEAARRAGYRGDNMNNIGSENLAKLGKYINARLESVDNERIASANEVLEYLTSVLRGQAKDQFGLDASLKDRNKAAELLGKRHALFTDKVEQKNTGEVKVFFNIPRPGADDGHSG